MYLIIYQKDARKFSWEIAILQKLESPLISFFVNFYFFYSSTFYIVYEYACKKP